MIREYWSEMILMFFAGLGIGLPCAWLTLKLGRVPAERLAELRFAREGKRHEQ